MNRRDFLKNTAGAVLAGLGLPGAARAAGTPNFVIIFLDDSGWGDFKPFGHPNYPTPNVERLASEGCRFNNFYVPQAVCSASRSALLSGCYPGRTKVFGAHGPGARGLDPSFATLGEVLKQKGYRTAVFGKWHIGDQPDTRPPARGFDESCGLMYSNDMWEFHPENPENYKTPLRFWDNGKVTVERVTPEHQPMLTTWYTEHAVDFINRNKANPFLLYVPHSMPHVPLFRSEKFKGKSGSGVYGDVMMEIDWSVGEILKALQQNGLDDNTLVIMTSDNGPWTSYGNFAGTTPFREAKGTGFDGGTRSACIMRYPGKVKSGSASTKALCTIDLLPTLAHLAGAPLPKNPIDGLNVWDLIMDKPGAVNPHDFYAFCTGQNFEAVMTADGHWKLHVPHTFRTLTESGNNGKPGKFRQATIELSLFDMEKDPFETINVAEKFPEVASRLKMFAEQHRKQFFN
ncbi:MAG: twin-arginine translocation signal domain-containing protein [Bryobacterales bacterium]|nr:twin-arginine translocation signal domain-containing protein [Bryobacterales bacterium]